MRIDLRGVISVAPENTALRYSTSAVLDAYEVLRQLVDDSASLASSLILVLADTNFVDGKSNRSLDAYTALKMRIWDDVKAKRRDNPLAPTVIING